MPVCPHCTADLPRGYGSVCPTCGFVVRVPGIVKLGLTLLAVGFAVALVWTVQADTLFALLWSLLDSLVLKFLGIQPPPFELTGALKALYDFLFGTPMQPPWGGLLLIAGGILVGFAGGLVLRRTETRAVPA